MTFDVFRNRATARTGNPDDVALLVETIRQNLTHNRRARYAAATRPLNPTEQFDRAEAANEREKWAGK